MFYTCNPSAQSRNAHFSENEIVHILSGLIFISHLISPRAT